MMTDYIFKTDYLDSETADYQLMTKYVVYEVNWIVYLLLFTSWFDLNIMIEHINNMKSLQFCFDHDFPLLLRCQ